MKADQLTDPLAFHGEGPFWDSPAARLLWVDLLAGDVLSLAGDAVGRHPVSKVAAVIRHRERGGFVVAVERGFAFLDEQLQLIETLPPVFDSAALRMNEGGCDPRGRFYCGSMAYDEAPGAGTLYVLEPDLTITPVLERVGISNGLQWSADGRRAFYNDSLTGRVDVFDWDADTGALENRRPFATPTGDGAPDGMAIDSEDGVWIALWGGSAVQRFDRNGRLAEVIELPVSHVTACTFGGPDLQTLFVTTSRLGIPDGEEPLAGAVFSVDTGVRGAEPFEFAG